MTNSLLRFIINKIVNKYRIINSRDESTPIDNCVVTNNKDERCANEGDLLYTTEIRPKNGAGITVKCYYEDGRHVYYSNSYGIRIRPSDEYIEKFFENLDVFQKNMLNRWSTPKYKMLLDFPHETDWGIETYKKYFTWPTKKTLISNSGNNHYASWNLDIETYNYETYLAGLLELCDFYDERCTNNLWRSLTHDSLKNMDYAFRDEKIEDDEYELGEGRFEEIIKCYGKQFDEIKQYIDNIKTTNNITYGDDNNAPSYFLSDKLESCGWEVYNLATVLDENVKVDNHSVSDININMMKYLQINSKEILSHKGTRHGIDMLLSLFGLKSYDVDKEKYDYILTEYVDTVKNDERVNYDEVVSFNKKKKTYTETYSDFKGDTTNPLQGLPVRAVAFVDSEGTNKYYLIPWFDRDETLDGNVYYQMYGGWGKSFTKELANTNNISDDIASTENIPIYNETIKNLIAVQNIDDLKFISFNKKHQNCVAYVYNIGNFNDVYKNDNETIITLEGGEDIEKATNYFILKNVTNSYTIGSYVDNETVEYGWVNVTENDIKNNTDSGIRVKLLESVIENHVGNNPHGGFAKYDDGETYIDYFRKVFKYSLENNNFNDSLYTCEDGLLNPEIENIGFEIKREKDNVKTWYFTNTNNVDENNKLLELTMVETNGGKHSVSYKGIKYNNINNITYSYNHAPQKNVEVGGNNGYTFFDSDVEPYNFEGGENYDEVAANSIINNKKLLIEFSSGLMDNSYLPRFLQECILPYLTQIIPSTTIWEVRLEGGSAVYTEREIEVDTID